MKKIISAALILALAFSLCACGEVQTDNEIQEETNQTNAEAQEEPEDNPYETLKFTLEEMVELVSPAKEIKTFTTYNTEKFTISKAGTTSDGVVCFSLPEKNELSVVYFLSYAEASSAYHRTEAKQAN